MATLVRRGTDPYDSVPGMTQTDGSSNYQSTGSIPFSGTGGSGSQSQLGTVPPTYGPYLSGSDVNYAGRGINPEYATEAQYVTGDKYLAPSPLTDYNTFSQMYAKDTSLFGMLASWYGPNMRRAQDTGFQEMYSGASPSLQSGFGANSQVGVNVLIDWDLPNKQAEFGTIAWLRKVASDLTPYSVETQLQSFKDLATIRGGPTYKAAYDFATQQYQNAFKSPWDQPSYSSVPALQTHNTGYVDPADTQAQIDKARYNMGSQPVVYNTPIQGWNKENVNYFGFGFGTPSYGSNERLAPTSISQGRGIFSSGTYSIRPNMSAKTMYENWGGGTKGYSSSTVNGRTWTASGWKRLG